MLTQKNVISGRIKRHSIACIVALSLFACGSSEDEPPLVVVPTPPDINLSVPSTSALRQGNAADVERFVKNGLYAASVSQVEAVTNASLDSSTTTRGGFSTTNTIEQNVDESDRFKYDGQFMYIASLPTYKEASNNQAGVRVLQRNDDFTLQALPTLTPSLAFERIDGIYLHDNKLAMVGANFEYYTLDILARSMGFNPDTRIPIVLFDVTNPAQATESAAIEIDGVILATRRINNNLYIISSYYPSVNNLLNNVTSDADKVSNFSTLSQTSIASLMPGLYKDGQRTLLNDPEDCYIPAQAATNEGYAQFVNITKINLSEPTDIQSVCLNTVASTLYMSAENLYLAANIENQQTLFHKVSLSNFDYVATGFVPGELGWQTNALFRLDEYDGKLRVVTSDYSQSAPKHMLSILEQQGNSLTSVATLPNDSAPQAIGKPGEDIYAVRFANDKAYVVTFERIDPLYVIDLTDATQPFIQGELEIPGFSNYIHILDNGYLLGIGQQISVENLPGTDDNIPPPVNNLGLKVSLFDVRDPANPTELGNIVKENAYTIVEFNYKALSVLNTNGVYQFAMPIERWLNSSVSDDNMVSIGFERENSLMLLQTDTNASLPSLNELPSLSVDNDDFFFSGDDRSIIQGNKVYYLRGNEVWLRDFDSASEPVGPF